MSDVVELVKEKLDAVPEENRERRAQFLLRFLDLPEDQQRKVCSFIISREEFVKDLERPFY